MIYQGEYGVAVSDDGRNWNLTKGWYFSARQAAFAYSFCGDTAVWAFWKVVKLSDWGLQAIPHELEDFEDFDFVLRDLVHLGEPVVKSIGFDEDGEMYATEVIYVRPGERYSHLEDRS
jgi:hypothetical protein